MMKRSIPVDMPYISGETAELGDRVCDAQQRLECHLHFKTRKLTELIVDWDDGTSGIHYQPEDFVLLERVAEDISHRL